MDESNSKSRFCQNDMEIDVNEIESSLSIPALRTMNKPSPTVKLSCKISLNV